jgi:hypothetical protein
MTHKEEWMPVNFDRDYMISNFGRVYSTKSQKIMKQKKETNGYMRICLSSNGKAKTYLVHRIVATAFIENKDSKPYVNHIDSNRSNNLVENLEWVTASENLLHGVEVGNVTGPLDSGKRVNWEHADGRRFFGTPTMLRRAFPEENISHSNLFHILHGKRKSHKSWRLAC